MNKRNTEEGWALVSVLCVVAMLALMAAATQALLFTFAKGQRQALDAQRAEATLDAAIVRAVLGICDQRDDKRWRADGTLQMFNFDGYKMNIAVQDQSGLIDLNAADASMIRQLFLSAGLDSNEAATLTKNVVDWRSPATAQSEDEYVKAHLDYHPRDGAFQSVQELKLVLGMTPQIYRIIEPAITVYTNRPAFDPNIAPEAALRALYYNSPDKVSSELYSRRAQIAPELTTLNMAGRVYSIRISLTMNGRRYQRSTVIELTGDDHRPYLTLYWQ